MEIENTHNIQGPQREIIINGITSMGTCKLQQPAESSSDNFTIEIGTDKKCYGTNDMKSKIEFDMEVTELLGSVTTQSCPGTRTSARVIQKMKQDQQTRSGTPPLNDREHKKEERNIQKTPSQVRGHKPSWTNLERNYFFDAVNEFGKDFEAIGNYINSKLKRRSTTDVSFKTKDQVRQHYYQTYHKICKYIRFSEEVRKPTQELYALINYGEMRRKLQFVTDKHFMKLRNLVYHGHITVRCKGKNIRIKTPSCKTLRRLNQLDDSLEDIRLPSKIEVIVSPANMEAFGRVQSIAQNPRVRTTVPLHKKLVNFIKTFQFKWRSMDVKVAEEETRLYPSNIIEQKNKLPEAQDKTAHSLQDPEICFLPKPNVTIHRPLLSITEYLSSVNICLNAYEERMGIEVRGEMLNIDRSSSKRHRTESGSEKRSPETKRHKQILNNLVLESNVCCNNNLLLKEPTLGIQDGDILHQKTESSGDELGDEIHELLSESVNLPLKNDSSSVNSCKNEGSFNVLDPIIIADNITVTNSTAGRTKRASNSKNSKTTFKPLLNEDVIRRIRNGWTVSTAGDITIGDLYVVLGHDSKLELDYYWTTENNLKIYNSTSSHSSTFEPQLGIDKVESVSVPYTQKQHSMPYNIDDCENQQLLTTLNCSTLSNKLKHLLLIANLSDRMRKRQCNCDRTNVTRTRFDRDLANRTFVGKQSFCSNDNGTFRQPMLPIRRSHLSNDHVKQLSTLTRQKMSKQVLVQQLLLLSNSRASNIQQTCDNISGEQVQPNLSDMSNTKQIKDYSSNTAISSPFNNSNENEVVCNNDGGNGSNNQAEIDLPQNSSQNYQSENMNNTQTTVSGSCSPRENFFDEFSNTSFLNGMSPMHLLRDTTSNSRWLEENLNDYSLTSLLGHLDEINGNRDILDPSSNLSVISESSVDYMHKFQEIKALLQNQEKD